MYCASKIASYTGYAGSAELKKLLCKHFGILPVPKVRSRVRQEMLKSASLSEYKEKEILATSAERGVIRMNFGTINEQYVIDKYCEQTGNAIYKKQITQKVQIGKFYIQGRIDALAKIADRDYIVEIKTRYNSPIAMKPTERVQILTYCNLMDIEGVLYLQCCEGELVIEQYDTFRSDYALMWNSIVERLEILTDYVEHIDLFRDAIKSGELVESELLKFLYWI